MRNKNTNDDNGTLIGMVMLFVIITGVIGWFGGFLSAQKIINNPQEMLEIANWSTYKFANKEAYVGVHFICLTLGIFAMLAGAIAFIPAAKIGTTKRPVLIKSLTILPSAIALATALVLFIILFRYFNILWEDAFPPNDNLVWRRSGKKVDARSGRIIFRCLLPAIIALVSSLPAIFAIGKIKNARRSEITNPYYKP